MAFSILFSGIDGFAATFSFPADSPFKNVDLSGLPSVSVDGITLTAVSATVPYVPFLNEEYSEGERSATLVCNSGVGANNPQVANVGFIPFAGADDLASESGALNFLETMTFCFDRSIVFSQIRVYDLEAGEQLTVRVESGPATVFTGSSVWSIGNSGISALTGSDLGELQDYVIPRDVEITFAFDAVDPLDRISDGNGSAWAGTPSVRLLDFNADTPSEFGLGEPFAVLGSSTQAVVGCDLHGESGAVSLVWSEDVEASGWTHTHSLGAMSPQLFTNAVMTNLTADTAYDYAFFATNAAGRKVWSATNRFAWTSILYVSPAGSDANSGLSSNVPLQTIHESLRRIKNMARPAQPQAAEPPSDLYEGIGAAYGDQLEAHRTNLAAAVTVKLLPGIYWLDEMLVIDSKIGGGIHFEGEWADGADELLRTLLREHGEDPLWMNPPETHIPVISGGRAITNWVETSVNGVTAWAADLPEVQNGNWYFQQLFVDGRRAERSRWPKQGWFRMDDIHTNRLAFQAFSGHMQAWSHLVNVEAVILHRWFEDRLCITNYDASTRWVQLAGPQPDVDLNASHPSHGIDTAAYYLDHVFETMSEPGEWYLNRSEGRLYYIPRPGETMADAQVVAPVLRQLFQISGKLYPDAFLWDVSFSKIALLHTRPAELGVHDGTANNTVNIGSGALQFSGVRAATVEACLFGHMGEAAVEFADQTMLGELGCNIFRDMAGTSVFATQSTLDTITVPERTGFLQIHDNDLKGYGRFWHGDVGMLYSSVMYSSMENNHVRDGYYSGIRAAAGGHSLNEFAFGNVVRKNRIHACGQGWLSDLAGIYIPGVCPYSVAEGNVVYDIQARDYTSPALYLDGTAQYWTVRNNWFYNCNVKNLNVKGWSHTITNNVIAHAGLYNVMRLNSDASDDPGYEPLGGAAGRTPPLFSRNIFLQAGGVVYEHDRYTQTPADWGRSDTNLFWDVAGAADIKKYFSLNEWQVAENKDSQSIEQDPLFIDPQRGDFRVPTNSPAVTQLGFVPFDNRDAGPRSNKWAAAGAVWYAVDESPANWMPSDVPGLQCWLDAADLSAGALADWKSKTPYSYSMKQFDRAAQPTVVPYALRGLPVVRFEGVQWMGNHEYLWDARQYVGRFEEHPFTIFTVHRADSDGVVLAKGDGSSWSVGQRANNLRWNETNYLGIAGTGWQVRTWQRDGGAVRYYEAGTLVEQTASDADLDFDTDDVVYLGGGPEAGGFFDGEIAEVLVYMGSLSSNDFADITTYLTDKWLPQAVPVIANESGATVSFTKAMLRAELTVESSANVVFYWGAADGGTTASAWEYAVTNLSQATGTTVVEVENLSSSTPFYYRSFAWNGSGQAWAPSTTTFQTLQYGAAEPQLPVLNGLQLWLAADDLDGDGAAEGIGEANSWGTVSAWIDKSPNGYDFIQPDDSRQPEYVLGALNDRPVLRFSVTVTNWFENATAGLGQFGTNDFAIFTVHQSTGGNTTVMGKGTFGGSGRWSIGNSQNQFRWNATNYLGRAGTDVLIRGYQRGNGVIFYSENGTVIASNTVDGAHDFSSSDVLYVGRRGSEPNSRPMDGDIAELLVYTGTVSLSNFEQITTYLGQKWLDSTNVPVALLYDRWADEYGLYGSNTGRTADIEPDGMNNLVEYALGGNPSDDDAATVLPVFQPLGNWAYHIHNERTDDPALAYVVQSSSNLLSNVWKTNDVEWIGTAMFSNHWKTVTTRILMEPQGFIRLCIEQVTF